MFNISWYNERYMEEVVVGEKYKGKRIDKCLVEILKGFNVNVPSRAFLKNIFGKGILVNGVSVKRSYKLKKGDRIQIDREYLKKILEDIDLSENIIPQKGNLNTVYENSDYLVINKAKGIAVHPGVGNRDKTISNYVRWYLEQKNEYDSLTDRAGIVHRLDKGVSGLMVIAKDKKTQEFLKRQFQEHTVVKIYKAEVKKFKDSQLDMLEEYKNFSLEDEINADNKWLTVKGYIGRNNINRFKMVFKLYEFLNSKPAVSHFLKIGEEEYLVKIDTGRMHQIRATFEYLGRYINGDSLYKPGSRRNKAEKISLESVYLSFKDTSGEIKVFNILK